MSDQARKIQSLVKELVRVLQRFQIEDGESISENLFGLIKTSKDNENVQPLIVEMVKALIPLFKDSNHRVREAASLTITQLVTIDDSSETKLRRDILNELAPLLQDPEIEGKGSISECIANSLIINHEDTELARDVVNLLAPFLQGKLQGMTLRHLEEIVEGHKQLFGDILNLVSPLLKASERFSRESACKSIIKMMKIIKTPDNQLIKNVLEMFTPLFKDPVNDTKIFVSTQVVELMQLADKSDTQLVKDAFDLMISLSRYPYGNVKRDAPKSILAFIYQISPGLSQNAIEALLPNLQEAEEVKIATLECITDIIRNCNKEDVKFIKQVLGSITSILDEVMTERDKISYYITEIICFADNADVTIETIQVFIPLLQSDFDSFNTAGRYYIKKIIQAGGLSTEIIAILTPLLTDSKSVTRISIATTLSEIVKVNKETMKNQSSVVKTLIPLLKDSEKNVRDATLKNLGDLLKLNCEDMKLVKEVIEHFVPFLQDLDDRIRVLASGSIRELLSLSENYQLVGEAIDLISPIFQHSNSDIAKNAFEIMKSFLGKLILKPDIFEKYLTHSSKNVRYEVVSFLLVCLQKYLNHFQELELMFQRSVTEGALDIILGKLFVGEKKNENLQERMKNCFEEPEKLKELLVSEINKIERLKGPGIIELAIVSIGQEKVMIEDMDRKKLTDLGHEVLNIQLKYLDEEGLIWINKNCEKLLFLSAEAKVFYKKVYHKLLEDGQISSLEEELLIKFINQGLTTSLTRSGEIIFEGKRYKLKGNNIELALEKIAKTVIEQQQDVLALQYKQHEPIFKLISDVKGGIKQAASDIKEIHSIVDSRHSLKIDSWLLTKLKSLKFNSEIFLLEKRSAFGDHVVYHFGQQRLIRFYPGETPILQELFGSYIYGEAYQGEVFELTDLIGQKLLENPDMKRSEEGKQKSKQIYFQQELLRQGNEDRNSAVEEELAKKLDNNRAVLGSKLKSLKLQGSEKSIIEDYYEGFISTFSSVYTSSQAIDSGKLSIADGEDFFSPVNLFIQLSSLAPFGIGKVLSGGLEAVRSHIKSTTITNEAKFVKDFAIDAVELSDLVSKIAINLISNKNQRIKILEAKDDEEVDNLVNKVKNLVMEKIEKLKNLAEKYSKMKNLFEKEVDTSPAFRLGESDANKIIKEWIELKGSQADLRMKPEEKLKKFVKFVIGENAEIIEVNKITPMPKSPQEGNPQIRNNKAACCEIF